MTTITFLQFRPDGDGAKNVLGFPAPDRIEMVGSVGREVADAFRSCAVYCLPSHGEPFGMSALEALSCGKPVVVTAAGGFDYLLQEGGGIKVPVRDPEKLAKALIRLLEDPQLCRRMGNYNRKLAVSDYAWDQVISRLEEIYEQAIQERAG